MRHLAILTATIVLGLSLATGNAEAAKRFGSGKSSGMQRPSAGPATTSSHSPTSTSQTPAAAAPARIQQNASPTTTQPKRSWMGPLAGLAAGLGLAALASHFGIGQELASLMLMALFAIGTFLAVRFVMRKQGPTGGLALATSGIKVQRNPENFQPCVKTAAVSTTTPCGEIADGSSQNFDADAFSRTAKVNFIRLQAANDARNLEDLRDYTTPELLAEIKANWLEEGNVQQKVDVISLHAEVVDVTEENANHLVSVRFTGLLREGSHTSPEPIDEVWHLLKSKTGGAGWVVAGIQQTH